MNQLLNDSFIAYVNLDHRNDRRVRFMQEWQDKVVNQYYTKDGIARGPLTIERIRGQYFEERDKSKDYTITKMLSRPQIGAVGCFASQIKIMKKALELDKHALVFEDDLVFCSDFIKRMDYIDRWTQDQQAWYDNWESRGWDILWLGGTFHVGGKGPYWHTHDLGRDAELTDDLRMIRTYGSFCTYGYIVNRSSIEKVLKMLDEIMPESIGIDWSMIRISPKLYTYAFVPGCVKQYDNTSDQIPSLGEKGVTEFSRFEKLNGTLENSRYWWQDRMEDFEPSTFDWAEAKVG